ncbi:MULTISPECIES: choice-of-anchor I family protein [unclassified Haladaptatus]|uniref:choice-of-anchor I family protein n=1 Tax=unclassified Haladaptatus TaxID=2622732 RepID=UPI00209BF448|nr:MULTISPECIES: choice-of-anchor I family protein [unclassified Haladaptatus]MCO8244751.1 choice-of-anchor I family protein [Haladaptatus sp. AB643]MCO8255737.1 choice-of-anchor I family protein [Haladaptatus sp. AB618]
MTKRHTIGRRRFLGVTGSLFLASGLSTVGAATSGGHDQETTNVLRQTGRYETGVYNDDAAEIPTYDARTERAFVVDANESGVDVLDLSDPSAPSLVDSIRITDIWKDPGPTNSADAHDGILAVAVAAEPETRPGRIVFYDTRSLDLLNSVTVGRLPDMVTFTPDGDSVLAACEGEPNDSYSRDPRGSITVIDVSRGVQNADVATAGFQKFDSQRTALRKKGVRIYGPNATVAQDLEPEFIAISDDSKMAYVTLQENNAIAIVDIAAVSVRNIVPLGCKDFSLSKNGLDAINDGKIDIETQPLFGIYQPDSIGAYSVDGETYLVTANEGDPRSYDGFSESGVLIEEGGSFGLDSDDDGRIDVPIDESQFDRNTLSSLEGLEVSTDLGDCDNDGRLEELYIYGGRSFAIWKPTDGGLELVFESGNLIESTIADLISEGKFPEAAFNTGSNSIDLDEESPASGPEPEGIAVGTVDGVDYTFVGLEEIGGVMVFDVSNPQAPTFVEYVNNRIFDLAELGINGPHANLDDALERGDIEAGAAGDLAPEGLSFVPADDSPTDASLLIVANELSGTTTIYEATTM